MTDSELLEKLRADGEACPFCGSDNLTRIDIDGGLNDLSLVWECDSCHAGWVEHYKAEGASALEKPDKSIVNPVGHERDMQDALARAEQALKGLAPNPAMDPVRPFDVAGSIERPEALRNTKAVPSEPDRPLQEEGHEP